ncbi:MAG: coenzyme F420-0:L-glutamate ligase [Bacilli bacterium]
MRYVGTVVRGIRTPVIKENDNLEDIVVDSLLKASESEKFSFHDKDIVAITEAVVGISSGNYVTVDEIALDIKNKFKTNHIGLVFPILSRNRFAVLLSAIARAMDKITLQISFPSDEVGNDIMDKQKLKESGINPYTDVIDEKTYYEKFGDFKHIFTGVNMVDFYKDLAQKEGCEIEIILANDPKKILNYEKDVLVCDIHTRFDTKKTLKENSDGIILGLDDILTEPVNGSGYNEKYGLLGSNRSTEERVKLFPRNAQNLVDNIQKKLKDITGKNIEVMVYGDGAFKDPVGGIWELADPVVSPFYTKGLEGSPNEIKLKYISDNKFANLSGEKLNEAIKNEIKQKDANLKGTIASQGTTPRRYTDLIGSLCDLTSGSGDKGTPVVYISGYFDNYSIDN